MCVCVSFQLESLKLVRPLKRAGRGLELQKIKIITKAFDRLEEKPAGQSTCVWRAHILLCTLLSFFFLFSSLLFFFRGGRKGLPLRVSVRN